MIRAHRDRYLSPLHKMEHFGHYRHHVGIAIEVIGLVEVPFAVALRVSEVEEVNVIAKPPNHARQVVVWPYAV